MNDTAHGPELPEVPEPGENFLPGERNIPRHGRIFVNRNLRLDRVRALGFDMDHTLALYNRETFEQLTFDLAMDNLVGWRGYPEEVRGIRYDPGFIIRGLVVDKRVGNLLKMDFHGYPAVAYHGTRPLTKDEKRRAYRGSRVNLRSPRYQSFDTLFSLPEGSLFAALVRLKERDPKGCMAPIKLKSIFDDVRACVDKVHRDGSLKRVIMEDPARYFVVDEGLRATLLRFHALGKKLFLLTNSEHDYTETVMDFLLTRNGQDWKELFDLVVVEARKPGFFMEGEPAQARPAGTGAASWGGGHVFAHGNAAWAEAQLGATGDEVLYFGDHTYGDILRSKKTVGWRTAMIVQELEDEVRTNEQQVWLRREVADLVTRTQALARDRDQITLLLAAMQGEGGSGAVSAPPWAGRWLRQQIEEFARLAEAERATERERHEAMAEGLDFLVEQTVARAKYLESRIRKAHNPSWGPLFREGNKMSRFGRQVKEFACVYTARVSNFSNYPGNFYFIAPEERMPHEL